MQTVAYTLGKNLYLNLTNRCTNNCRFCIRHTSEGVGYDLWLDREPSLAEVLAAAGEVEKYREVVFCGYGEPLMRLEVLRAAAQVFKNRGATIRINTNGQANLIYGRDIVPELRGLVDVINVSLNAHNAARYVELCRPSLGEAAFGGLLDFARRCVGVIPEVVLSVVEWPGVDVEKCREIASRLGASLRVRKFSGTLREEMK